MFCHNDYEDVLPLHIHIRRKIKNFLLDRPIIAVQNTYHAVMPRPIAVEKNKKLSYRRDSTDRRSLRRSRQFKVTDFGTNRKPICDFSLVININLMHSSLHRFQYADHWSHLRSRQGVTSL